MYSARLITETMSCNSWDEWVGADRLMKHTEDNVLKQQALDKKQGMEKSTRSGRSQAKPKSSAGVFSLGLY